MENFNEMDTCGNWLGKARRNFNITRRCWQLLHVLCLEFGLNHSNMLELCVREMYVKHFGKVKKQPPDLTAGEFNRREC